MEQSSADHTSPLHDVPLLTYTGPALDHTQLVAARLRVQHLPELADWSELDAATIYALGGAEVLDAKAVEKLPASIKMVCFLGTGYEFYLDVQALRQRGIELCYTPYANAYATAEFALALLLAGLRQITQGLRATQAGNWETTVGKSLKGATVGIIGFGHVGRISTDLVQRLDATALVWNRTPCDPAINAQGPTPATLEEIVAQSDAVLLHTNITPAEPAYLTKDILTKSKHNLLIINTARAKVINETDLFWLSDTRPDITVLSDVYYNEPPTKDQHTALADSTILLTPHLAGASDDATRTMAAMLRANCDAFQKKALPYPIPH